jgi:hypothetical protein
MTNCLHSTTLNKKNSLSPIIEVHDLQDVVSQ